MEVVVRRPFLTFDHDLRGASKVPLIRQLGGGGAQYDDWRTTNITGIWTDKQLVQRNILLTHSGHEIAEKILT